MKPTSLRLLIATLALGASAALAQGQPVGRVLLAAGDTFAVRNGQPIRLSYNSPIEFKDTLRTGAASTLQVRFNDESLLSLRENTDFQIEEYRFAAGQPDEERGFFRLIKGGFRSITGLIGRARHANYRVHTQTATIGIRGTDYAARMCAGDCGPNVKDGLYGSVLGMSSGSNQITVQNEGTPEPRTFGINQHFYVPDARTPPQPLLQPPTFVSMRPQGKAQAAQEGGSGTGGEQSSASSGAQAESRPSAVSEPIVETAVLPYRVVETYTSSGTPTVVALPPPDGFAVFYPVGSSFEGGFDDTTIPGTYNGQNQLTGYGTSGVFPYGSLAGGSITDTGSFTLSNGQVFTYGRWTGAVDVLTGAGPLTDVPLLFLTATGVGNGDIRTIGGQAAYAYRGGPQPVDAGGNVGSVTSSVLNVDFTTQVVSLSLGMSFASIGGFGSADFNVSGPGAVGTSGDFSGTLSGTCVGGGCASGSAFGAYDVGFTGVNGISLAVVGGGLVNATQAGGVAFLNAYDLASYTSGPAPAAPLTGQVAWADAQLSPGSTFGVGSSTSTFDAGGALIGFTNPNPCGTGTCTLSGTLGGGMIGEQGSVPLVDGSTMTWGRWIRGSITEQQGGATPFTYIPSTGVPYVLGSANTTLPASGSFLYSFAGGPNPTDTSGVSGAWVGGSFNVTFGATQTISTASPLTMTVNGATFSLTGSSTLTSPSLIQNLSLSGTCSGGGACITPTNATGSATGIFVGPQAGGLALAGNVMSPAPTISFAGAFKR